MSNHRIDEALLRKDLREVISRAFFLDDIEAEKLLDLMIPGQIIEHPHYILPQGQNVYSFLYTIRMTLEGDRQVRGRDIREAKHNLLQELTQGLSIREIVAQSMVMPICPVADIDIKDGSLLHGIEYTPYFVPQAYMPRRAEMQKEMEQILELLHSIGDSVGDFTEQQKEELIARASRLKQLAKENTGRASTPDIDLGTVEQIKTAIKRNPATAKQLADELDENETNQMLPELIRETLNEE